MTEAELEAFARALLEARRSGHRADAASLGSPDYDQALRIQRAVQAELGQVGGFKVARRPEGPPVIAPVPASRVFPSGAEIEVRDRMGIELEIGFEALTDYSADMRSAPYRYFRPRVVLELVDPRLVGAERDHFKKLADMQINEGLVVGDIPGDWDGSDFSTPQAVLRCGADSLLDGAAYVPGGSAIGTLQLFLDHVGEHCGGLRAGQIVITGSLSPLRYYPSGVDISGSIEGIGGIACRFI